VKTIKPQRLGFACRTFETSRKQHFVPTVFVFFDLANESVLLPEIEMWPLLAEALGAEVPDEGMPKSNGELLLNANAYPPGGAPASACIVRAQVGAIDKTLAVSGDRYWERTSAPPFPFRSMPLRWEHAFGGETVALNPAGKGARPVQTAEGVLHPLPNIEDPRRLVRGPDDRPPPAGFSAYDFTSPQRASKAGTYDAQWLKDCYPGFPPDMDWSIFNAAPEDQRLQGFFAGGEPFVLENLHPEKPTIRGRLPSIGARCFVGQKTPAGEVLHDVPMRLETVRLLPHLERGVLVFRGVVEVQDDEADDVTHVLVACEDLTAPRDQRHYRDVLQRRLDPKTGFLHGLADHELLPHRPGVDAMPIRADDPSNPVAMEGLLGKNLRRRATTELDEVKAKLVAMGLDPNQYVAPLPREESAPSTEQIAALGAKAISDAEKAQVEAATQLAAAERDARARCAAAGVDYDKARTEAAAEGAGPPKFRAGAELARMKSAVDEGRRAGVALPDVEAQLADPSLLQRLQSAESALRDAYRRFAHAASPAPVMSAERTASVRAQVFAALSARESLAGVDLTGANLTNLPFAGADLRGAFLECADLSGVDLTRADLTNAVLTRANLTQARMGGAKLAGANLGSARLAGALLDDADLTGAVLVKADLTNAAARGAQLTGADLAEVQVRGADLRGAIARELLLVRTDLRGANLAGVDLTKSNFLEVDLTEVDLSDATLSSVVLLTVRGDGAIFRGARLDNLRVVERSTFARADFRGASLVGANLRATALGEADFRDADLDDADLSGSDLQGADFTGAHARGARFAKANLDRAKLVAADLLNAILKKASLLGADLSHANLFQADLARVRLDTATIFRDANLQRARVNPGAA
jgi:uncharacterized protein YjbI with pentapeptide repeats